MSENFRRTNQKNPNNKSVNWWKWLFLLLISLIVIGLAWFVLSVRSVSINEPNNEEVVQSTDEMVLSTSLAKEDAERLINSYLTTTTKENATDYTVSLTDQLEIAGTVDLFNLDVPFTLYFDPYVVENGNLQLRAESVQLASFSMPVSAVMSILANQLEVPTFIAIDSDTQMIVINLNELRAQYDIGVEMTKVDLENDDIQLNLFVDEISLIENMNLEGTNSQSTNE